MKKYLLLLVVAITSLTAWADADITSGSLRELKSSDVRVLVTWDYEKMLIEDKTPADFLKEKGADWEKDYPAEVAAGEAAFDVLFNKKDKKYALITDDEDAAQFEFVIHVDQFHYGSTGAAVVFGGFARGAHIEGTVEVVRMSDKAVIATIKFDCSGKAAYSNEARRVLAYQDLAQDLAKMIGKSK